MVPSECVILSDASVRDPSILASSATIKSSVDVNCSADTIAEAVTLPVTVWSPIPNLPSVAASSLPNHMVPS